MGVVKEMDKTEYRYISYRHTNKSISKYYNYRTNEFYYDTVRKRKHDESFY